MIFIGISFVILVLASKTFESLLVPEFDERRVKRQ